MKKFLIIFTIIDILVIGLMIFFFIIKKENSHLPDEVFNDKDIINISLDKVKEEFSKEEYYIESNYERYLKYKNKNNVTVKEAITCVNSRIDYDFYTNVVDTDLSKGILILVNKYNKLSENYVPDLVTMGDDYSRTGLKMQKEAYEHFKDMVNAAKEDGYTIYNISSYRSYSTQNNIYNRYVKNDGQKNADTYSARPGYSEHQTGFASDIITTSDSFAYTKEYKWLKDNSYKYGFILRYPKGKEYITGYQFEPWHYRYVGLDVAKYIYEHDITFEEYYEYFIKNKI